jgi:hypothetical protein
MAISERPVLCPDLLEHLLRDLEGERLILCLKVLQKLKQQCSGLEIGNDESGQSIR